VYDSTIYGKTAFLIEPDKNKPKKVTIVTAGTYKPTNSFVARAPKTNLSMLVNIVMNVDINVIPKPNENICLTSGQKSGLKYLA